MSKRKMPKNISAILKKKSKNSYKDMETFISDAVSEKLDKDKVEFKTMHSSIKYSFVQKDVVVPLHIPYDILNELCKTADEFSLDLEKYIVKVLKDETDGKHLTLCGGIKVRLK